MRNLCMKTFSLCTANNNKKQKQKIFDGPHPLLEKMNKKQLL